MAKRRKTEAEISDQLATSDTDEQIGIRMDKELYDAIGDYADKTDAESMAAATRELLSIGLTETGIMEEGTVKTLKENARRSAIRRMAACMHAAIATFKEQDLELEEEIGEE